MESAELKSLAVVVIASVVSLLMLAAWHLFRGRRRLVLELPTSKVAGVTLGLTELRGEAHTAFATVSPHGQKECVFWRQEIFVEQRDENGRTHWRSDGENRGGRAHLDLVDETGSIRVWVKEADIDMPLVYDGPMYDRPTRGEGRLDLVAIRAGDTLRQRRVKEYAIGVGDEVFVVGTAVLVERSNRPEIGPDPHGTDPFLVTTKDERALTRQQGIAAALAGLVSMVAAAVFGVAWTEGENLFGGGRSFAEIDWTIPAACVFLVSWAMLFLSLWHSYNGLVTLRNRAQRAWSLLDVEITRRHQLLPPFIDIVRAHHAHETSLHHRITALRAGWVADRPAEPNDEAVAQLDEPLELEARAVRELIAVVETFPDLRANESSLNLQRQLCITEDRIALGRHFYNDSVERLRTRRNSFPDSLVAWMFDIDLDGEFTEYWDERVARPATAPPTPALS